MSITDQIDFSLERASSLQRKRMEAEETKQKSLNYEIQQLKNQFDPIYHTPSKSDNSSQYSPLRDDIKQIELQNQLLESSNKINHSYNQIHSQHSNSEENINHYDEQDEQLQIQPIYDKKQKINTQNRKQIKQNKKKEISLEKTLPKQKQKQQQALSIKQQQQQKVQQQKKMIKPQSTITTIMRIQQNNKQEKENNYIIQEDKQDYQNLQKQIHNIKQQVQCQLNTKESIEQNKQKIENQNEQQIYKIRGYRDQAEIKYFGRPLPCNECVFLLNKGMSSDFCSQHGKINKERPSNKVVPKRLAKFY